MSTLMKAMLACMPATAVLAMGDTQVIGLHSANISDNEFHLEMGDTLELLWKGPGDAAPFQEPEHLKIQELSLRPLPYSVLSQGKQCQDSTERISMPDQSLAKYVVDGRTQTWINRAHSEFDGVFTMLQVTGRNDWAYGHNRLLRAGQSSVEMDYTIPFAEIREHYPNAQFKLNSGYFAAWKMSDLVIETTVNGHVVHDSVEVAPENEGRTYHSADLNDILANDEDGTIVVKYESGWGPLFLWYFEIVVENLDQEISEEICTWKWHVKPMNIFQDNDRTGEAEVTYDLTFTTPDNRDHLNSLTILYNH